MTRPHLYDLTISEASRLIHSKELSPVELTQACLNRIDQVDERVQAWVTVVRETALRDAEAAEHSILHGESSSPLHGIPFGAKDLYYTAGIRTAGGSRIDADFIPTEDAAVITRLKSAGAILLGKTTTTEYAFFGGVPPTRNPWNLNHTPGGSSSGSAAALAASMAIFTLGTQTAGSLSRPASYNGLTGLKPTYGRISKAGIMAGSWSLDHAAAFTRTVEDAAMVLNVLAGPDRNDPATLDAPVPDYTRALEQDIGGKAIGIPDSFFFDDIDAETARAVDAALEVLKSLGARIVSVSLPPSFAQANIAHRVVMNCEAAAYHRDSYRNNADMYNPSLREMIELGLLTPAADYLQAQRIRTVFREELSALLRQIDILAAPSAPTPAPEGIAHTGSPVFNIPFTNAGVPTISIPVGFSQNTGLPVGLQMAARPLNEEVLISFGHAYQKVTDWHKTRPVLT
ncbi:amidase [Ferviditalea candida]|uniref:Amidase n=1 Tax=Ferviditalea candida TaxID=3108399 RepID=A0ABU5ZC47_9BACL|nr:amidase [Paenibacillaceae bacterium T2]